MKKGNGISTMKIDDFCRILGCNVNDIIEYKDDWTHCYYIKWQCVFVFVNKNHILYGKYA